MRAQKFLVYACAERDTRTTIAHVRTLAHVRISLRVVRDVYAVPVSTQGAHIYARCAHKHTRTGCTRETSLRGSTKDAHTGTCTRISFTRGESRTLTLVISVRGAMCASLVCAQNRA
jgi:hypothetical protein